MSRLQRLVIRIICFLTGLRCGDRRLIDLTDQNDQIERRIQTDRQRVEVMAREVEEIRHGRL